MKRLLPFLALLVLLAGCTGTTPDQLPVLLFVTHERDGDQLAALVADRAGQDDRFLYLEDTETVLPGTPLALDVAGRGARRDEAFVLLETPGGEFELARFDLRGIDADAAVLPAPERTNLTDVLVDGSDGALEDGDVCLRDVQVDAAGSVLAFMNVPSECDSSNDDAPSVLVLDTDGGNVRMLAGSESLVTSGLFIRQRNEPQWTGNTLYHLLEVGGLVQLWSTRLPDGTPEKEGDFSSKSDDPEPVDLAMGLGQFLALQPDRLNLLSGDGASSYLDPEVTNARSIVADDYTNELEAVVILAGSQVIAVREDGDDPLTATAVSTSAAALNSDELWIYLGGNGRLYTVNLLDWLDGFDDRPVASQLLDDLGSSSLLTWFRSEPPPPPPGL